MQSCWREKYLLVRAIKYADDTMIIDQEEGPVRFRSTVTDPEQSKTKEPLIDFLKKNKSINSSAVGLWLGNECGLSAPINIWTRTPSTTGSGKDILIPSSPTRLLLFL